MPVVVTNRFSCTDPLEIGPILRPIGYQDDRLRLSALFILKGNGEPPDLEVDGLRLAVPPRWVKQIDAWSIWRFDFALALGDATQRVAYRLTGREDHWRLWIPAKSGTLRIAFTPAVDEPPDCPGSLLGAHRQVPLHFLLSAGFPQAAGGNNRQLPQTLARFRRAELAALLATLPLVEPATIETADNTTTPQAGPLRELALGAVAIITIGRDSFSADGSVFHEAVWPAIPTALARLAKARHLLLLMPPPLLLPDQVGRRRFRLHLPLVGRAIDEWETKWSLPNAKAARQRLITLLTQHSQDTGARVTIISYLPPVAFAATLGATQLTQICVPSGQALNIDGWAAAINRSGVHLEPSTPHFRPGWSPTGSPLAGSQWLRLTMAMEGGITAEWYQSGHGLTGTVHLS